MRVGEIMGTVVNVQYSGEGRDHHSVQKECSEQSWLSPTVMYTPNICKYPPLYL